MTNKQKRNLAILIILIIGIPVLVYLALHPQFFKPKAAGGTIEVFGDNIINLPNGQKAFTLNDQGKPIVNLRLISPFGPPTTGGSINTPNSVGSPINTGGSNGNQTQNSSGPSLSFSPSSGTQRVGAPFDVNLTLNSGSSAISFVDFYIQRNSNGATTSVSFIPSPAFNSVVTNGPVDSFNYHVAMGNSTSNQLSSNINLGLFDLILRPQEI